MPATDTPAGSTIPAEPAGLRTTRQRVLDAIQAQPGVSKSALVRTLGLAWGTVWHHVRELEKSGQVVATVQGRETLLAPGRQGGPARWLQLLAKPEVVAILRTLRERPQVTPSQAAGLAGVSSKVARRRLSLLAELGLAEDLGFGRARFRLVPARKDAVAQALNGGAGQPFPTAGEALDGVAASA